MMIWTIQLVKIQSISSTRLVNYEKKIIGVQIKMIMSKLQDNDLYHIHFPSIIMIEVKKILEVIKRDHDKVCLC